ncbi:MAG TPA: Gfo/Idh/MocA family oxidoreductase [Thermoguttaceae bacterium]|nr:Gfo/Idh/MocA family oxidoreductase [Thermoguttaceae bacterium]
MSEMNRRQFLDRSGKTTLGFAAGATILANARSVRSAAANERLVLAMVGVGGGRGHSLAMGFLDRGDCEIAYVCDVNRQLHEPRAKEYASRQGGKRPQCMQDFREMLEDASVDAVVIATPPHWHALATILCCRAGKDVYCEKPQSHSCWEGRQAVEAARKYDRIVQIGTQNRSAPYNLAAKRYLEEGKLGRVHLCRVFNQKFVADFEWGPDEDPPETLDWDMWNGPAPERKYNKALHLQWRQLWDYSGGDMAYDAIHQIDLARWLCGVDYPSTAYSTGGRFNTQGAAETPDTQMAVFEFPEMLMTFEETLYTPYMLKTDGGIRDGDMFPYWPQNTTHIELYGDQGVMYVGRMGGGWQVYVRPKSREPVVKDQMFGRFPDPDHKENFVQSVRSRNRPNADVEEGHRSTLLVHYANISYRLGGRKLRIDPKTERIVDDPEAMRFFKREYRKPWVVEDVV